MSTHITHIDDTSRRNRSAISNGSWLLEGVDNRTAYGRRYRDLCIAFAGDLGGGNALTSTQEAMIRQAATVTVESEKLQSKVVRGEPIDHEQLVRLLNLQARLVKQLGIKPKSKPKRSLLEHLKERTA